MAHLTTRMLVSIASAVFASACGGGASDETIPTEDFEVAEQGLSTVASACNRLWHGSWYADYCVKVQRSDDGHKRGYAGISGVGVKAVQIDWVQFWKNGTMLEQTGISHDDANSEGNAYTNKWTSWRGPFSCGTLEQSAARFAVRWKDGLLWAQGAGVKNWTCGG
jgi:hypothetical protein